MRFVLCVPPLRVSPSESYSTYCITYRRQSTTLRPASFLLAVACCLHASCVRLQRASALWSHWPGWRVRQTPCRLRLRPLSCSGLTLPRTTITVVADCPVRSYLIRSILHSAAMLRSCGVPSLATVFREGVRQTDKTLGI